MVIIGTGGHAIEVIDVLSHINSLNDLVVFDNVAPEKSLIKNLYPFISSWEALSDYFKKDPAFVLGVGNPSTRKSLASRCSEYGGNLTSVIAHTSLIGEFNIILEAG